MSYGLEAPELDTFEKRLDLLYRVINTTKRQGQGMCLFSLHSLTSLFLVAQGGIPSKSEQIRIVKEKLAEKGLQVEIKQEDGPFVSIINNTGVARKDLAMNSAIQVEQEVLKEEWRKVLESEQLPEEDRVYLKELDQQQRFTPVETNIIRQLVVRICWSGEYANYKENLRNLRAFLDGDVFRGGIFKTNERQMILSSALNISRKEDEWKVGASILGLNAIVEDGILKQGKFSEPERQCILQTILLISQMEGIAIRN